MEDTDDKNSKKNDLSTDEEFSLLNTVVPNPFENELKSGSMNYREREKIQKKIE